MPGSLSFRWRRATCFAAMGAALSLALPALAQPAPAASAAPTTSSPASVPADCPPLLRYSFDRLQDEKPQLLCQYTGKVVLIVNTASFCGFTPQYKGLEALYDRYKDRGLVVLGFPSNDFSQERGSNKQIADFCESTFGVKFPMFSKSTVRGPEASALFRALAAQSQGQQPQWNFHKYLIGRNGQVVANYPSQVEPTDKKLTDTIERLLAAR